MSLRATRAEDYLSAGIPKYNFVVDPFFIKGAIGMMAGSPGSIKTWDALDLALAVGSGADWLGVFPTKQGPVLCLDQENSRSVVMRRLSQLREVRGFPPSGSNVHLLTRDDLGSTDLDFTQEADFAALRAIVDEVKPVLIIIDSLREFHSAEENSSTFMLPVMRGLKALAEESDAAILIIHHLRKDAGDIGDAIRGSGHFRATVESILGVVPDPGHQGRVTVMSVKNRYVEKVDPFQIQLVDEPGGGVKLEYLGVGVAGKLIDQAKQAVLGLLQQAGDTERSAIIQHVMSQVQCSYRTAAEAISRLARETLIQKRGNTNPAIYGVV
ncbi:MAG: AAA family ATPase [Dehalococcoidia bacterium]|jgi:predicted ATP-dependent serine protease